MEHLGYANILLPIIALVAALYIAITNDRNIRSNTNYANLKYNLLEYSKTMNDQRVLEKMVQESASFESLIAIYNGFCVNVDNQYAKSAKDQIITFNNLSEDENIQKRLFIIPLFIIAVVVLIILWIPIIRENVSNNSLLSGRGTLMASILDTFAILISMICGYFMANYPYVGSWRGLLKKILFIKGQRINNANTG